MTTILGILNITADSFSDGGKYLEPGAAIAHGKDLIAQGADVLDLGAASSNPDAEGVPPDVETDRLAAVVPGLSSYALSIDSHAPQVQRWALAQGVAYLNDIHGFPDPALYPALAGSRTKLIVMHAVQRMGRATRVAVPPGEIMDRITDFFDARLTALESAGIGRDRLILDPGMGFFLGTDPEASLTVLRRLPDLGSRYRLPILVSVSRKSFLRRIVGRDVTASGPASLAAELFAIRQGSAYIRTHAPGQLRDALAVATVLDTP
jgi:dihydropteroate synthase type 2